MDIYPTLAELCQIAPPANLEGKSFGPLIENPRRNWKTAAFSIYPKQIPGVGEGFGRALRTDRYRLVEWSAAGSEQQFHELYDHAADPQENVNIANLPRNQPLLQGLLNQLHAGWQKSLPPKNSFPAVERLFDCAARPSGAESHADPMPIKVSIVEDSRGTRQSLAELLGSSPALRCVGATGMPSKPSKEFPPTSRTSC